MSRTLAERFRTQRTDRIRVDGFEVLSMIDIVLDGFMALEVVVESVRDDLDQALVLRSRTSDLRLVHDGQRDRDPGASGAEVVRLEAGSAMRAEVHGHDAANTVIQIWNSWSVAGTPHAWTGNSGILVEPLPSPEGVSLRQRLWCSDGLGPPTFEDLVVLLTIGPRALDI